MALKTNDKSTIYQACCNHWNCPVCWRAITTKVRARIVHGAGVLASAGRPLYFWTFTCRGRDLDMETADDHYYTWTNKALTNLRRQAARSLATWAYVQVTERQRRGAAHSHFIHTFAPTDATEFQDGRGRVALKSDRFMAAVVASGLGPQCQITRIETPEAVAHYIAGYLEKHGHQDVFPPGWKRVRWSRDWPDLPEQIALFATTLSRKSQWDKADRQHVQFVADSDAIYQHARRHMVHVSPPAT